MKTMWIAAHWIPCAKCACRISLTCRKFCAPLVRSPWSLSINGDGTLFESDWNSTDFGGDLGWWSWMVIAPIKHHPSWFNTDDHFFVEKWHSTRNPKSCKICWIISSRRKQQMKPRQNKTEEVLNPRMCHTRNKEQTTITQLPQPWTRRRNFLTWSQLEIFMSRTSANKPLPSMSRIIFKFHFILWEFCFVRSTACFLGTFNSYLGSLQKSMI
jgi:hypothetical protein